MSTFYYWLPCERPFTSSAALLESLRAAGLAYAVENKITPRTSDCGPDSQKGVVVCHGANADGRLGWWPNEQTWKRIPGTEAWCGCYQADRPRPSDLAREEQISGDWLTLDDGYAWLVPKARRWIEIDDKLLWNHNFPRRMTLNDDGAWVAGGLKPKYERLWTLATAYEQAAAEALSNAAEEDQSVRFVFPEIDTLAVSTLQVNYRVGAVELDLLGVYDEGSRQRIIDVLLDNATWQNWLKKKLVAQDPAGGNS